jgi:hypothetical protein
VGYLGRVISPSQGRYLTQTQNKRHPFFEWNSNSRSQRLKTVHALDREATVISILRIKIIKCYPTWRKCNWQPPNKTWQLYHARCALSEAWTLFARSNTGVVGSNSTRGIDVCVRLFCEQVTAFRWADPPSKESYRLCIGWRNWKKGQGPTSALEPLMNEWIFGDHSGVNDYGLSWV